VADETSLEEGCPLLLQDLLPSQITLAHTGHTGHTMVAAALGETAGAFLALHKEVVNLVIITHCTGLALSHQYGEHKLGIIEPVHWCLLSS
jgi:hypothetical protein